jgi:hypothetical protein
VLMTVVLMTVVIEIDLIVLTHGHCLPLVCEPQGGISRIHLLHALSYTLSKEQVQAEKH